MKNIKKAFQKIFSIKVTVIKSYEDMRKCKKITEYKLFRKTISRKIEQASREDILKSFNFH